jgi:hypothetical protein
MVVLEVLLQCVVIYGLAIFCPSAWAGVCLCDCGTYLVHVLSRGVVIHGYATNFILVLGCILVKI